VDLFPVEGPWPGRLALCSRPRSGWFLEDDIRALRPAGYDILVSALTPEETVKLDLERVPEVCATHGVEFVHFPVGNLMVPAFDVALPALVSWYEALGGGRGVALHCWGTVGRSPTLAAALLALGEVEPDEAWRRVEAARGREVPDTLEQRRWVSALARLRPSAAGNRDRRVTEPGEA
jgi:hypothetical protein